MEIEYKIKTTAELAGAEAAADALERQIGKLKALKQDYSGLEDQLKTARASIDEYKKGTEGATEAGEEHSKHLEGMNKVFGSLNRIVPELGHSLHAAFIGPLGPLILLGMAISEARTALAEYNQELDEEAALAAQPAIDSVKNVASLWDEAKSKMGQYYSAIATAGQNQDAEDQAIQKQKELTAAKLDGIKQIIESLGVEEVARLRASGADESSIKAAQDRTAGELSRLDDRKKSNDVGALKQEFADRSAPGKQEELNQRAEELGAAADAAALHLKNLQSELEKLRGDGTGKSTATEKLEKLEKLEESFDNVQAHKFTPSDVLAVADYSFMGQNAGRKGTGRDQLNEDMDAARREIESEKARKKQIEGNLQPAIQEATTAETAAAIARAAGIHNAQRAQELPGLISSSGDKLNLSDASGIIERGVTAENAVQKSGKATADQVEAINKLHALAAASGTNMATIIQMLNISHAAQHSAQQDIETIKQKFITLSHQTTRAQHAADFH